MICFLALLLFSILALFSAKYRPLAREAFSCVFRKLTLRKCETGLNTRLKSQITGKLLKASPRLARIVYRNFEILSWIFTIMTVASFAYSAYSFYNFVQYGNCYGPETKEGQLCIFEALEGETNSAFKNNYTGPYIMPKPDASDPSIGPDDAPVTIIEFGCYMCPYTRQVEPTVQSLLTEYGNKVRYVYKDFALSETHSTADLHAEASHCALEQARYWEYRQLLFSMQETCGLELNHTSLIYNFAQQAGLNMSQFSDCFETRKYKDAVALDFQEGIIAGVKGTPSFFINSRTIVGPKPIKAFRAIIDDEMRK